MGRKQSALIGRTIAVLKKCSLVLNPQRLAFVRSGAGSSVGRTTQSVRSDRLILICKRVWWVGKRKVPPSRLAARHTERRSLRRANEGGEWSRIVRLCPPVVLFVLCRSAHPIERAYLCGREGVRERGAALRPAAYLSSAPLVRKGA